MGKATMQDMRKKLKKHFGYDDFRPFQKEAMPSIVAGNDLLCVAATSAGKSVLFQIPAVAQKGLHIVVSPLIALMRDQVNDCRARKIPAAYLNSQQSSEEVRQTLDAIESGEIKLVYVSPEKLATASFRRLCASMRVRSVNVDESHCGSTQSFTFRPEYALIGQFVRSLPKRPRVLAVTATCTTSMEVEIAHAVGFKNGYDRVVSDPVRPNIEHRVVVVDSKDRGGIWSALERVAGDHFTVKPGQGKTIVYCRSRRGTEVSAGCVVKGVARTLVHQGTGLNRAEAQEEAETFQAAVRAKVGVYHAGMQHEDIDYVSTAEKGGGVSRQSRGRKTVQDQFKDGTVPVMVATCAFGMGIDTPDVRVIAHVGLPGSLEDYAQQSGRASRDGKPALSLIITDDKDVEYQRQMIVRDNPAIDQYTRIVAFFREHMRGDGEVPVTIPGIVKFLAEDRDGDESIPGVSPECMTAAVNMMKRYGAIDTKPGGRGYKITGRIREMRQWVRKPTSNARMVRAVQYLIDMMDELRTNVVEVDGAALKAASGLDGRRVVDGMVKRMLCVYQPVQMYEMVTMVDKDFNPVEYTDFVEMVENKQQRDFGKLKAMVDFVNAEDKAEAFRSYFLEATF